MRWMHGSLAIRNPTLRNRVNSPLTSILIPRPFETRQFETATNRHTHRKTASSEDNTFLKHRASRRLGGQRSLTLFGVDWTGDVLPICQHWSHAAQGSQLHNSSRAGCQTGSPTNPFTTKCCSSTSPRRNANATAAAADSADVVVNCMTLGHHRSWSTSNGRYAIITCLSVASSSALGFVIQQHHRRSACEDRQLLGEMLRRESYK
uniref:Uncharacterized protein n=1 Tax=Caenorhabditis japonica TaxID=281687 RepID=A0A8R1E8M9_CAEJA